MADDRLDDERARVAGTDGKRSAGGLWWNRFARRAVSTAAVMVLAAGCAPRSYVEGVSWTLRRSGAASASLRGVRGYPCLRLDSFLLDRLNHLRHGAKTHDPEKQAEWLPQELPYALTRYSAERGDSVLSPPDDPHLRREAFRESLRQTLTAANRLATAAYDNEFDRLTPNELRGLWRRYFPHEAEPPHLREVLRARFRRVCSRQYDRLMQQVERASSVDALARIAREIVDAVEKSPKDHHGRGPILALVARSIDVPDGPLDHGGPLVDLYVPDEVLTCAAHVERATEGGREDELLLAYAPVIVQERLPSSDYPPDTDRIGTVRLEGRVDHSKVRIDTAVPSVYAYWRYAWIHGRRHLQLTYTYWFPRHPKLKRFDPEAGRIEGAVLRITLDEADRPALFETLLACGCYHRCYPSQALEEEACRAFGGPEPGKRFCVERHRPEKLVDWIVPETVAVPRGEQARPLLFSRAGYHGPAGISFRLEELESRTIREQSRYTIRCYEELEHLPVEGGYGSMFDSRGLVRGANRLEGSLLGGTGMLRAGHPRARETQLLHWDQYDFDDPHVLERSLRLPPPADGGALVRGAGSRP